MNNNLKEKALNYHKNNKVGNGKIEVIPKVSVVSREELSLAYTPGVAVPCLEIKDNPENIFEYTIKQNTVFVVSDGSAVLGLGNIGSKASLPVMEGKSLLFKIFGGIDAYPIIINTQDNNKIIETVQLISDGAGGINLEDIAAPRCFEIEDKLTEILDIPVFHDDQHGTAVVSLAGLINSLKIVNKNIENIKVVINGSGAAGISIVKLLLFYGCKNIIVCDTTGIIHKNRTQNMNKYKYEIAEITNPENIQGNLEKALEGSDVFIGVSVKGALTPNMIKKMNNKPIIFALANPDPEILPEDAYNAGACIVATGRSDFPNQINNALGFPGIFRGLLDVRAKKITMNMKLAASIAIANCLNQNELDNNKIIPSIYEFNLFAEVAEAVAQTAIKDKVARHFVKPNEVYNKTINILNENKKRFFNQ